MPLLDRYLLRAILASVGLVMSVLLILGAMFLFIDQQDDIGVGHYTVFSALQFAALNLPQTAWELLPVGALIGALLGLGSLARGSELIVFRASGVSVARIAGSALIAGMALVLLEVALGEFLASPLQQAAKRMKAFDKFTDVNFGGNGGAWVRDGNLFLNVEQQSGERQFGGMLLFDLSPEHKLRSVGHADSAISSPNKSWALRNYSESRFQDDRVLTQRSGERMLESNVSADFLGLAVNDPSQLEIGELVRVMRYYRANALDDRQYRFAFWSRIARTTAILFTVLLAIPFVLGSLRSAGAGARTVVGLLLGVGFFMLQRLIESGTVVFALNPVLLAWLPTALLALVSVWLLIRAR